MAAQGPAPPAAGAGPPLVRILARELDRNFRILREKGDPAPYYMCYRVTEVESDGLSATLGAVTERGSAHRRSLDCSVRTGTANLDNFHSINGERPQRTASALLPVEDSEPAIARIAWRETDRAWRSAAERLMQVQSSAKVRTTGAEEVDLPDFSSEGPAVWMQAAPRYKFSAVEWSGRLRKLSQVYAEFPAVLSSSVSLMWQREVRTFVDTEGARIQHGRNYYRIMISAAAKGYDGNDLNTYESFVAEDPAHLPKDEVLEAAARKTARDLTRMLRAQAAAPWVGPAILSGQAAAVFFHEIFGHRVEGHRQRDESEGQTFTASLGKPVLPEFLSVIFDPTLKRAAGADLNGWYEFDDEGARARRTPVVENGILKTFLMSRMPVAGVRHSNGHGRAQPGLEPVSRQSNLIVESSRQVPFEQLRRMLKAEIQRQGKPYGLYFEVVTGGFTSTRRRGLQAFIVIPLVVYRVFPDDRPDEIIRGADIVGTPLASFGKILATSDKPEVFNGYCGAESGNVPVSAVSPSLLVEEIEIQKKPESKDLPPILPRPATEVAR